jgi:isopenicillin N synthase-like dioxygenase
MLLRRPLSTRRRYSSLVPPLVDVRCFNPGGDHSRDAERDRAAVAASSACRMHGLLALPFYGGIPAELVGAAFSSVHRLFELPFDQKMELAYRDVRENVGYIKPGNEKLCKSQIPKRYSSISRASARSPESWKSRSAQSSALVWPLAAPPCAASRALSAFPMTTSLHDP